MNAVCHQAERFYVYDGRQLECCQAFVGRVESWTHDGPCCVDPTCSDCSPSLVEKRTVAMQREQLAALKAAAEPVCSLRCPSVKHDGEPWTHVPECTAITTAIARAEGRA